MTDFATLLVADRGQTAHPVHLVDKKGFEAWLKKRPAEDRHLLHAQRFDGKTAYAVTILPRGPGFEAVAAVKDASELSPWCGSSSIAGRRRRPGPS
jgi:leucyl aminopeptidase